MKLGIIIDRTGTFLFKVPENDSVITMSHVQKNMLGWLFHDSDIYGYISLLPIEKYVISCGESDMYAPLTEITGEKAQEFYSALATRQEEKTQKVNR